MNINRKIREARKKKGLSQSALATLVGVKPQAVQQWELEKPITKPNGKVINPTAPSRKNQPKVAEALGFASVSQLFDENDAPDQTNQMSAQYQVSPESKTNAKHQARLLRAFNLLTPEQQERSLSDIEAAAEINAKVLRHFGHPTQKK